jgi:hypothetical protein
MKRILTASLATVLSILWFSASTRSSLAQDVAWQVDAWMSSDKCDVSRSARVTVNELSRAPDPWLHKCLAVHGYIFHGRIFADLDTFYRDAASERDDAMTPGVVGEYGLRHWNQRPRDVTEGDVIGVLRHCSDIGMFDQGYCDSFEGRRLVLVDSGAVLKPFHLTRLVDEDARQRVGNLQPVTSTWFGFNAAADKARRWHAAVRSGDFREIAKVDGFIGEPQSDYPTYNTLLHDRAFAELRDPKRTLQMQVFEWRTSYDKSSAKPGDFSSIVCFCRFKDCSTVWPISETDADNAPQRPYVCLSVDRMVGNEPEITMHFGTGYNGLREPSWTSRVARGEGK